MEIVFCKRKGRDGGVSELGVAGLGLGDVQVSILSGR